MGASANDGFAGAATNGLAIVPSYRL
ncbi:MAG: hypothetical protein JWO23_2841, partial [Solirubrobacterales bacterium]|nr:hypothetical protein [Solirubrobacterales bacterium]